MLTAEQVLERRNYIGASDAAAVLGLSRWSTQLEVWAIKTGRFIPEDISDKPSVKMGHKLEQTVAELFMEATGKKVHRVNETIYHKEYPFLACNLDRRVVGERAILQCKTCSAYKAREWDGEEIPQEYIIQEYHELACSDYDYAYIAVLIGGQDFRWKMITKDEAMIKDIVRKEVAFWNNFVITNVMPMQIQAADSDVLYSLFPVADPNADIILGDEANALVERIDASSAELKALENDIEKYKNELKAILGDAEKAQTDQYKISWKNQDTKRLDTERLKTEQPEQYMAYLKVSKSRVFRYSKKEQK